ncbi:hypothetical protein MMC07_008486 [Pseudocyphellaria aurata]|nr:hypothetical protein [Pseudocyphellaria aurata]
MRSHLTLHVFRQLTNYTLCSGACSRMRPLAQCYLRARSAISVRSGQRRSLFGYVRNVPRKQKPVDLDPGLELMSVLCERLDTGTRPPPSDELAKAFNAFFQAKIDAQIPLEDVQVQQAMRGFNYLRDTYDEVEGFGIGNEDLRVALSVLGNSLALHASKLSLNDDRSRIHNQLAVLLSEELGKRRKKSSDEGESLVPLKDDILPLIQVLSLSGDSLRAREIVERHWYPDLVHAGRSMWVHILRGFAREDNNKEILNTIERMQKHGVPFDSKAHQSVVLYYTRKGDVPMTKKWYQQPIADSKKPTAHADACVLRLCLRNDEFEWGTPIFKAMLEKNPESIRDWSVVFEWAAARGKGVDEIERMMEVMVRRNEDNERSVHPNIETINALVELANSKNDSYTAERYVALGQKWGFQPNAETYLLQLDYRIKVGDLAGARVVYDQLQSEHITENQDIPLANRLIVALCAQQGQRFDVIMAIVEDLNERKVRFEPETVAALTKLHLDRGDHHDLVDLLHTHLFHFGLDQRASIRDIFVEFCLDRSKSTARVWDAYSILHKIFPETEVETRTKFMKEFFDRQRGDMAFDVFGHMRQKPAGSGERPMVDTYVAFFEGIAKCRDLETLQMVRNMLNLDPEIEINTRLYNGLMLAFTSCGQPHRALEFWADIIHSREGPTYSSIQIALRACEDADTGAQNARDIWARLKRFEIKITAEICTAYIAALAAHELLDEGMNIVGQVQRETGVKPDAMMLGTFYNAMPTSYNKVQVERWASRNYPSAWRELMRIGLRMTRRDGLRIKEFRIQRDLKA